MAADKGKISTKYAGCSEWEYVMGSSNPYVGDWTITATKGTQTKSEIVSVSEQKQYEVLVLYDLYLIKDGLFNTDYTHTFYGNDSRSSLTEDSNGYVYLYSNKVSSSYATCSIENVDVTYYKYLVFDGQARGYYSANVCPAFGILLTTASAGSYSTFRTVKMIRTSRQTAFNTRETMYLDITSFIYSNADIGLQEAGSSSNNGAYGGIQCYNLYLSNTVPT